MIEKLKQVLSIQSESYNQWRMFAYIVRQLKERDCSFYTHKGNIYVTKGMAVTYPCVVAHMDTVHDIAEDLTVLHVKSEFNSGQLTGFNTVTMTQTGIGGDDKVGIFVALEILDRFDDVKLAFFRDEEVGCVGSKVADMDFFDDVSFVLQCDRRGNSDFINIASGTKLMSKAFQKAITPITKRYNYKFASGMMTDVMMLKENKLGVSCANISCGYYNPHMANEYVVIDDVFNALELVTDIIKEHGNSVFPHTYERSYGSYGSYAGYGTVISKPQSAYKEWWEEDDNDWWARTSTAAKPKLDDALGCCDGCQATALVKFNSSLNAILCDDCTKYYA